MGIDARMFAKIKNKELTPEKVLSVAVALCEAFRPDNFLLHREVLWDGDQPHHALSLIPVYNQDGPDIVPERGEQFVEVHLFTRFYGPQYERGDLPLILAVSDWLQFRFPGCEVWYGGDSSGVAARHLNHDLREELWNHFCQVGHGPYERGFDKEGDGHLCEFCQIKTIRNGWGKNYAAWYCPGCGDSWVMRDGVTTKEEKKR